MKNISKILGVVLTLALLAGLLMMAVPVSAGTASWSESGNGVGQPVLMPNSNANIYTIAADGKTMFMYSYPPTLTGAIINGTGTGAGAAPGTALVATPGGTATAIVTILAGTFTVVIPGGCTATAVRTAGTGTVTPAALTAGTTTITTTVAADTITITVTQVDTGKLYKSTDAGLTWSNTGLDTGATKLAGKVITSLKVSQTDVNQLIATDGIDLFRSINGGQIFSAYDPTALAAAPIISIDMATSTNGSQAYLVGTITKVHLYDAEQGIWCDLGIKTGWTAPYVRAMAVAFSPNYASDTTIVAVANDIAGTGIKMRTFVTFGDSTAASAIWGAVGSPQDVTLVTGAGTSVATNIASVAFPSNFDPNSTSYNKIIVGIGTTAGTVAQGVYRANAKTTSATTATLLDGTINVYDVSFKGTASAGTLAVGQYNAVDVLSTTTAMTAAAAGITWTNSGDTMSSPTGSATVPAVNVQFSPANNNLYAGTAGASSGLFMSTDYMAFGGVGFLYCSALGNVSMGKTKFIGNTWMLFVTDSVGPTYLFFLSMDAGATWKLIRNNANIQMDSINVAAFATDKTIMVVQKNTILGNGQKILKTSDAGATWTRITSPGNVVVTAIAMVDANTFWCGSALHGIQLSTSANYVTLNGESPVVIAYIAPLNFFFVSTYAGTLYASTDQGATFTQLGNLGQFINAGGNAPPDATFDTANKIIYAQSQTAGSDIQKWAIGASSTWDSYIANAKLVGATGVGTGLISSMGIAGGNWYITSIGNAVAQIYRSSDLTDTTNAGFTAVIGTAAGTLGTIGSGPENVQFDAQGNATYINVCNRVAGSYPATDYAATINVYFDNLLVAPATLLPKANDAVNATSDFTWTPLTGNNITYTIQVAYDSDFTSIAYTNTSTTPTTIAAGVTLTAGKNYFWRVRLATPILSKWSATVPFTVKLQSNAATGLDVEGRMSPINGATGIATNAPLTWGVVTGADSYNLKVATDAAFTNIIDTQTGLKVNVYAPAKPFTANTTYFWEVQSVNGTGVSNWVASAFTTAVAAAPAGTAAPGGTTAPVVVPTYTIVVPTQAAPIITVPTSAPVAPTTPAYIWVIIVIGAILVIAVVVLIVRTRRV